MTVLFLIATGLWACVHSGLYFSGSYYLPAAIWLLGAGGLVLFRFCFSKSSRDPRKSGWKGSGSEGISLLAAGPAVLAGLYVLRLAAKPLTMQGTLDAALRWGWLAVMAAAMVWTAGRPGGRLLLRAGWNLIGTLLSYTALMAVYGLMPLPHAVLRTADSGTAAFGARLGGLLQYPNTFGAVMAAFLVLQLLRLAGLPQAAPLRWRLVCSAQALPYGLCLLLSESRGAWLAAAAAWTAAVITARGAVRGRLIVGTGWIMAGAILVFRRLAQAELAPPPLQGLAELAAAGAAVLLGPPLWRAARDMFRPAFRTLRAIPSSILISIGSHSEASKSFESLLPRKSLKRVQSPLGFLWSGLLAAGLLVASCFVPLGTSPHESELRTSTLTVSARWLMYRDSFTLFREAPWFGQGGEVWRSAYRSVQSLPYVGSVMHSSLLDILLNLGLVGTMVWLIWLFGIGMSLARRRQIWLWPYLVLVFHAAIDFDSSFGLHGLLVIWAGAQAKGRIRSRSRDSLKSEKSLAGGDLSDVWPTKQAYIIRRRLPISPSLYFRLQSAFTLGAAALLLLLAGLSSLTLLQAERLYQQAQKLSNTSVSSSTEELRRALQLDPMQQSVRATLAARLPRQEAILLLRSGLRYDPHSPELYSRLALYAAANGDLQAAGWWEEALRLDRYNRVKQLDALRSMSTLADLKRMHGREEEAEQAARAGLLLYSRYEALSKEIAGSPVQSIRNDRGFYLTEEARERAVLLNQLFEDRRPASTPLERRAESH